MCLCHGRHKEELEALGPLLLARWQESGADPWTVRAVTEALKELGWREAEQQNAWLLVRSWLLGWSQVRRVGQDYWIPADQLPQEARHTRLQVLPVRALEPEDSAAKEEASAGDAVATSGRTSAVSTDESRVVFSGEATALRAAWLERLRTINLLEGFLHIPASARGVYPIPMQGEDDTVVLAGRWFEDGSRCWLWLDRARHRLYGPDLAEKLAWLEAGDMLQIEWAPDVIVLRMAEIQSEEARLVDLQELMTLRGGLGESYRRSLQAILQDAPAGLTFAEVVKVLRERQQHTIHRGTIRALLYSGGFVQKDRRWFPAPDGKAGARHLREVMVETLVREEEHETEREGLQVGHVQKRIKAIHKRLTEIVDELRKV